MWSQPQGVSQLLHLWMREHYGREGTESLRTRISDTHSNKSPRNVYINKTGTTAKSMDLLISKGKFFAGSNT